MKALWYRMAHGLCAVVFSLLLCGGWTACSNHDEPEPEPVDTREDMTIMCYFIANNNLEEDLYKNIVGMYQGMSAMPTGKKASLLVYWDGSGRYFSTPRILKYHLDENGNINGMAPVVVPEEDGTERTTAIETLIMSAEVVKEYPSQLSTDMAVMQQALADMAAAVPSKKYGLVAGSHGSGWLKKIDGANSRSFGLDNVFENTMQIADMATAIMESKVELDFLLFDACMMSCIEVAYELRHACNYLIASPIIVPSPGFPYNEMTGKLFAGDVEHYAAACTDYINRYANEESWSMRYGVITLCDCAGVEALTQAMRVQLMTHQGKFPFTPPSNYQYYGEDYTKYKYYSGDLLQFVAELNDGMVPSAFREQFQNTVIYSAFVPDSPIFEIDPDHCCGMGVYVPRKDKAYWNEFFMTLSWYTAAGWDTVPWQFE